MWFLSTGNDFQTVGHLIDITKATVCITVNLACHLISTVLLLEYITVPSGADLTEVIGGFKELGFPQCIGAVDGTHPLFLQMSTLLITTIEKAGTP